MKERQIILLFVSDNGDLIRQFSTAYSSDKTLRFLGLGFNTAFSRALEEENPDAVVIDATGQDNFDYRLLKEQRENHKNALVPFIFLGGAQQEKLLASLSEYPHNHFVTYPVSHLLLRHHVERAIAMAQTERRNRLYKYIVDGEKQMISSLDELLDMKRVAGFGSRADLLNYMQNEFVGRLELALAVEKSLIALYNSEKQIFTVQILSRDGKEITYKFSLPFRGSRVAKAISLNTPVVLEQAERVDPFVQRLEEGLNLKVHGLLFVPLVVLHQPLGAIVLVNKLYRNDFAENDVAFTSLAAQRVVFRLEELDLKELQSDSALQQRLPVDSAIKNSLLLERVLSAVDFGLIIFDENKKIHYSNSAAWSILNRNGQNPGNLEEVLDRQTLSRINISIKNNEFPLVRQEIRLSSEVHVDVYIGYSVYMMEWNFGQPYFIMVFSEISQTKRIQSEIIRMDRMASLGILSSGIAHEIRNPLAGIKAMAQNMEEELPDDTHLLEYVRRILRQVNRLDELLRSFFSYARPTRPDPKSCQLKDIFEEVLALLRKQIRDKNIEVRQLYDDQLNPVFVDANQIQQVFINMILNSIQAMEDGGTLTIEAGNTETQKPTLDRRKRRPGLLSSRYVQILLRDTGTGFDEETQEMIFDPFFTTKSSGTGLGLAIVYQIIREHGGQIDVTSRPDEGTQFSILLPAYDKESALEPENP